MEKAVIHTKNAEETQKIAKKFAESVKKISSDNAVVIALEGELGAGKTTFVQGFMQSFGITEHVVSPTFVVMKMYAVKKETRHLVHIDCYRLDSPQEILHLGFENILQDRDAVILIEWAEKIKELLPEDAIWIKFEYGGKPEERILQIKNEKIKV
ncbi:MAG: tRNA (adenosine(37)-N6)-threonylcarbamoyltransferase complex ATPase subunit type 1 TsaE [Candidatus Sungbacteria bacterium]|nr:tRNA (adenosine(37)-N6)-threonylcarbamoyltransferase complex ATPase subunit type 1 TsaE [Candidatus Sungbacteria bacterium]